MHLKECKKKSNHIKATALMFTHLHLADIFVQSDLHQFIHRWQRLTRYVFTRFFFNSQISDSALCWCVLIQFFFIF